MAPETGPDRRHDAAELRRSTRGAGAHLAIT
jgi:hypothetical protein